MHKFPRMRGQSDLHSRAVSAGCGIALVVAVLMPIAFAVGAKTSAGSARHQAAAYSEQTMNIYRATDYGSRLAALASHDFPVAKRVDPQPRRKPENLRARRTSSIERAAVTIAARERVPADLFLALIWAESSFNPSARSHVGAIGLTQLMPRTAQDLGVNPYDPVENLVGGARYLRQQYERFGSWHLALAAYNAGPTRVTQARGVPNIRETRNYVNKIITLASL